MDNPANNARMCFDMARKDDEILPGLELGTQPWQEVRFEELDEQRIQPYQVVTGFGALRDLNILEEKVCMQLTEDAQYVMGEAGIKGPEIAKNRLAGEIRPENFNGRLTDTVSLVFPFDVARAAQYRGHVYIPANLPPERGMSLLVMGTARSSAPGVSGLLFTEATYYDIHLSVRDRLRRIIAGRKIIAETGSVFTEANETSAARARSVARFALRHLYHG